MFRGSMVALVTPFQHHHIDLARLFALIDIHLAAGTQALIVAGTTGESGTLTANEHAFLIKQVVSYVKGAVPIVAGLAANATASCIQLAEQTMACGADALLVMTPAYIRPTQEGLFQHYAALAHATPLPIILYNVPARTACDLLPETVERLAAFSNIVGLKDATGSAARLQDLRQRCGDRLDIYSGDDLTAAEWLLAGAKGVISVTANVAPHAMVALCHSAAQKDRAATLQQQATLMPLHQALFVETNPIPVKWALHTLGYIENELRLPLTTLSAQHHDTLREALRLLS